MKWNLPIQNIWQCIRWDTWFDFLHIWYRKQLDNSYICFHIVQLKSPNSNQTNILENNEYLWMKMGTQHVWLRFIREYVDHLNLYYSLLENIQNYQNMFPFPSGLIVERVPWGHDTHKILRSLQSHANYTDFFSFCGVNLWYLLRVWSFANLWPIRIFLRSYVHRQGWLYYKKKCNSSVAIVEYC